MSLGKRIASLRSEKKMSQAELAKRISVSPSTIGMWETDQRAIKDDDLLTLANFFDVSTDYLLGKDPLPKRKLGPRGELLASHIDDGVSDEDMEDILRYIEFRKKNPL